MRYLKEENDTEIIGEKEAQNINKELVDIGTRIEELNNRIDSNEADFNDYVTAPSLVKQSATLDALYVSKDIEADTITTNTLTAHDIENNNIKSKSAEITEISTNALESKDINTDSVKSSDITTNEITASEADIITGKFNTITANEAAFGKVDIDSATITTFNIENANIENTLKSDVIEANEADIKEIINDELTSNLIKSDAALIAKMQTHNITYDDDLELPYYVKIGPETLPTATSFRVLEVPYFNTGEYRLALKHPTTDITWWAIIVRNDHNNLTVSYSRRTLDINGDDLTVPTLDSMFIWNYFSEYPKLYIKTFVGGNLYWQNSSLNEELSPIEYEDYPFDTSAFGALPYQCLHDGATWFSKHIDLVRNAGVGNASLFLTPDKWDKAERGVTEYNGLIDIAWHFYFPNQSVNNNDEVKFRSLILDNLEGKWLYNINDTVLGKDPDVIGLDGQINPVDNIIETNELSKWNGKVGDKHDGKTITSGTIYNKQGYNAIDSYTFEKANVNLYNDVQWDNKQTRDDIISYRRKSDLAIIISEAYVKSQYTDEDNIIWDLYTYNFPAIGDGIYEQWIERKLLDGTILHRRLESTVDSDEYIKYTSYKEDFEYGSIEYNKYTFETYHNPMKYVGVIQEGRWNAGDIHIMKKDPDVNNTGDTAYDGNLIVDGTTKLRDDVTILNDYDDTDVKRVDNVNIHTENLNIESDSTQMKADTDIYATSPAITLDAKEYDSAGDLIGGSFTLSAGDDVNISSENLTQAHTNAEITINNNTNLTIGTDPNKDTATGKLTIKYADIELIGHKKDTNDEEIRYDSHLLIRDDVEIGKDDDYHNLTIHGKLMSDIITFNGDEGDTLRVRNIGTASDPDMAIQAEKPAIVENGTLISEDKIVKANVISLYNGTVNPKQSTDDDYDVNDNTFPITEIGANATLHGDTHILGETLIGTISPVSPMGLQVTGDVLIGIDGDNPVHSDLKVMGSTDVEERLIVKDTSNLQADVTIGIDDESTADLYVTGNTTIDGTTQHNNDVTLGTNDDQVDLYINGNIYQYGADYETHAEKIFTTKDHIIMREGAVSGLITGEHAGLQVMNYDGNNTQFHLCIDKDGYGRIGDTDSNGDPVNNTFTYTFSDYHIVKGENGEYFDSDGETLHNFYIPNGAFDISYTEAPELDEDGVDTGMIVVTFTYKLTEQSLQKIATITENAIDQSLLYYDLKSKSIKSLEVPATIDYDKALVPVYNGNHIEYRKYTNGEGNGSVFVGTQQEYEEAVLIKKGKKGYLPDNAIIIITDADDEYLKGEVQ